MGGWRRSCSVVTALVLVGCGGDDAGEAPGTDAGTSPSDAGEAVDSGQPAIDGGGAPCVGCGACTGEADRALSELERTLLELPADTWYAAPGTAMREVCAPDSAGVHGVVGCSAIVSAWGGGAYDRGHRRMILWGGGHNDYWGNELYAFDLATGAWTRLTEPSAIPGGTAAADFLNQDPLPDGQPVSRHTYDGIEYVDHLDRLLAHGGSRASDGSSTPRTWLFDLGAGGWSMASDGPGGFSNATAYDPESHLYFVRRSETFFIYDLDADTWEEIPGFGVPPLWPRYAVGGDKTGAIDPGRGLFWSVGSNDVFVWDIAAREIVTGEWVTTGGGDYTNADRTAGRDGQLFESGGGDVYDVAAPGFDYDEAADALVAWPNAGAPYALDLASRTWTTGSADGAPESHTSGGTYGRWRYVRDYNVFILVTSVDEDVHFYKHTAGCGE